MGMMGFWRRYVLSKKECKPQCCLKYFYYFCSFLIVLIILEDSTNIYNSRSNLLHKEINPERLLASNFNCSVSFWSSQQLHSIEIFDLDLLLSYSAFNIFKACSCYALLLLLSIRIPLHQYVLFP
ncbi:unnamed protein product [Moneuplotes crassus]|uniref:Uncharacterized protein n=1 Tax=Euplotes crassus TaxID=5936 RepID=A0AAD1Y0X2_EUPCR|nr:unnamed protein product [Moneuplotes crassus]